MNEPHDQVKITWDFGTGYDLFISLYVLHLPKQFQLRASWAAGVRSRLTQQSRNYLKQAISLMDVPLTWLYTVPEPKDGMAVLKALAEIEPVQRLPALSLAWDFPTQLIDTLQQVAARCSWDSEDEKALSSLNLQNFVHGASKNSNIILDCWAHAEEFGQGLLDALKEYYDVFFAEEEQRIKPVMQRALQRAQELACELDPLALYEALSRGLRYPILLKRKEMVMAPSYWSTPLVFYDRFSEDRAITLFGARSMTDPLIPGDDVPDTMVRGLKAVSDPMRLRILRHLARQSMPPSQLARQIRLRAPTVIHHLSVLRVAGLVQMTRFPDGDVYYSLRKEAMDEILTSLHNFFAEGDLEI